MACLFALTLGAGGAGAAGPARAYEMVSPVEKENASVRQDSPGEFPFQTWDGGNSVLYTTQSPFPGAGSGPLFATVLAKRSPDGWSSIPLDPPTSDLPAGSQNLQFTLAVSEDQNHAFVFSTLKLAPQATKDQGNYYIRNLETGEYEFVGSSPEATSGSADAHFYYLGGTADFSAIEFTVPAKLTPEAAGEFNAYLWSRSQGLQLISILPDGTPNPGFAGTASTLPAGMHQLSEDGTRAFFTSISGGPGTEGLFLYENGHTRPISTVHIPGEPETLVPAEFLSATPDGNRVMFVVPVSQRPLTPDAPGLDGEVYIADIEAGTLELAFSNAYDGVQFVSGDLSTAIFEHTGGGASNIWHEGETKTLGNFGYSAGSTGTSANGRYMAVSSALKLTEYDNTIGPACEFGCVEIYLINTEDGEIICASCRTDGQPPTGNAEMGQQGGWAPISRHAVNSVTNDGRVFFDTPDPLVAADSNGVRDVYEYDAGSQRLISTGSGNGSSVFAEATPDGSDVFFITTQRLVAQDKDDNADLYDARVGGGIPGQNRVPESNGCELELCGLPTMPPAAPVAGSEAIAPEVGHVPVTHKKSKQKKSKHRKAKQRRHKGKSRGADAHAGNKGRKGR